MSKEMKLEVGDLVLCRETEKVWHVERLAAGQMVLRRGAAVHIRISAEEFEYGFLPVHKEPVIQAAGEVSELDKLEHAALRNLRDVVRGELRERDKKTGFFDEAKAWVNLRNALSVC